MGGIDEGGFIPSNEWVFYFPVQGKFELNFSGYVSGFHFCSEFTLDRERTLPDKTEINFRYISPTHAVILCRACGARLEVHSNSNTAPIAVAHELRELEAQEKAAHTG